VQARFDVHTATAAQLAQQRDQLYAGLPPSGRDAQGKLALWALGVGGVTGEELDKVILDDRVQWELRQTPVDPLGLTHAAESASIASGGRIYDALRQPFEKLLLLSALGA
jgi:hypothetical protein